MASNVTLPSSSWTKPDADRDIMTVAVLWTLNLTLRIGLNSILAILGLITNTINVLVFRRVGVKDGVTGTFMLLSVTDILNSLIMATASVNVMLTMFGPTAYKGTVQAAHILILAINFLPDNASINCTMVITVVRCCCVVIPFKVKSLLTVRRQLFGVLLLTLPAICIFLYTFIPYKLVHLVDPRTNATIYVFKSSTEKAWRLPLLDRYRTTVFYACFVATSVCLMILVIALHKSASLTQRYETTTQRAKPIKTVIKKEKRVAKTVILVAGTFTVCRLPGITMSMLRQTLPGFSIRGPLSKSFDALLIFTETLYLINIFVNIFIYFYSSSKYREALRKMLGRKEAG